MPQCSKPSYRLATRRRRWDDELDKLVLSHSHTLIFLIIDNYVVARNKPLVANLVPGNFAIII